MRSKVFRFAVLAVWGNRVGSLSIMTTRSMMTSSNNCFSFEERCSVGDAYRSAVKTFESAGLPESDMSARILIAEVSKIGYRMSDFNRNQELQLTGAQIQTLAQLCQMRMERRPLQYIIGNWDFFGFTIKCRPPVLIPRPETEELVEYILNSKILQNLEKPRILDIGAGTGAIGIALLKMLPRASCDSIDINEVAVQLANENAADILEGGGASRYSCKLTSFLDFVASGAGTGKYDLIVSNPPYIPSDEMLELEPEVAEYEDSVALHGGDDGLSMIREILLHSKTLLRDGGPGEVWMEVARRHPSAIEELLKNDERYQRNMQFVEGIKDLSGNPRFVRLKSR